MNATIPISEIFGPTLQGEGRHIGRRAIFIRTLGCDSKCEWCDTKFAWGGGHAMTVDEILRIVNELSPCKLIVLTGGNPAIHDCGELVGALRDKSYRVHVETQGTIIPYWFRLVELATICPKISSEAEYHNTLLSISRAVGLTNVQLKYVVFSEADYEMAFALSDAFRGLPMTIQPGYDCEHQTYPYGFAELARRVAMDKRLHDRVRFLPQLHRIVWGDIRGV